MRYLFVTLLSLLSISAQAWTTEDMNAAIEQTNFIVEERCSGTLISAEYRLVLTNHHCVRHLVDVIEREVTNDEGYVKKVRVRTYKAVGLDQHGYKGYERVTSQRFVGDIVAEAQKLDLAIVQTKGTLPHKYATPLAAADPVRGSRIYTVGNPAMYEASIFEGIVSNVNRTFEFSWTDGAKSPMIQFSGGIVGGNSGGALYNDVGELVGVPSAGSNASDILGLAIPVSTVKEFLKANCWMKEKIIGPDLQCRADKLAQAKKEKD